MNPFKLPECLSLLELTQVEIFGSNFEQPLGINHQACADVVATRQHKLVVKDPLRLGVDHSARMQNNDLVVLQSHVVAGSLQGRCLHKET